jgi:hypothetical protein
MSTITLAHELAEPIGRIGMYYYFSPLTSQRATELGTDVVSYYFAGRGGVLGEVDAEEVDETFYFFKPGMASGMYSHGVSQLGRSVAVREHAASADTFARATFGAIAPELLTAFADAVQRLADQVPLDIAPLADGYLALEWPGDPAARAFRAAIYLRELRGGVHTQIVKVAGLPPAVSCYLDHDGAYFALHGYGDDDLPTITDEHRATRLDIEERTHEAMETILMLIDESDRQALKAGSAEMFAALKDPIPVA